MYIKKEKSKRAVNFAKFFSQGNSLMLTSIVLVLTQKLGEAQHSIRHKFNNTHTNKSKIKNNCKALGFQVIKPYSVTFLSTLFLSSLYLKLPQKPLCVLEASPLICPFAKETLRWTCVRNSQSSCFRRTSLPYPNPKFRLTLNRKKSILKETLWIWTKML